MSFDPQAAGGPIPSTVLARLLHISGMPHALLAAHWLLLVDSCHRDDDDDDDDCCR